MSSLLNINLSPSLHLSLGKSTYLKVENVNIRCEIEGKQGEKTWLKQITLDAEKPLE